MLRLKTTPIKPKEEEEDGGGSSVPRPEAVPTCDWVALTTTATQGFSTFAPPSSPSPTPFAVSFLRLSFQRHNGISLGCAEGCKHKLTLASSFCLLFESHFTTRILQAPRGKACRRSEERLFHVPGKVLGDPHARGFGEGGRPGQGEDSGQ